MPKALKRKVRRSRHRWEEKRTKCPVFSGVRVLAPIIGQADPRELHAFVLLDQGQPLSPVQDPDRDIYDTYLREV